MNEQVNRNQNIILENRKKIFLSGIKDVVSYDDETLLLDSDNGRITVKGADIKISSFNAETGDLEACGTFHAAVYMNDTVSGGFFSRLFK